MRSRLAGGLVVVVALLAWLWPIGVGGMMPVGGDVTSFFLGLMAVLHESLGAGRIPVWNDLWGYGFPGLAESQMGVYYPPHLLIYRFLSTESAYVLSLVLHTLWGGLGTYWAARRLGVLTGGSVLAAFTWSACGFFFIHLAHPWGYTTGCWMPWALGLSWSMLRMGRHAGSGSPFLLSLVLVLQLLPGHFQLAFQTELMIGLLIAWAAIERFAIRLSRQPERQSGAQGLDWRQAGALLLVLVSVFPLAALQLWPTARLARLAVGQRDFEYLSGFSGTPFHLINYVAPGLFHRSALWRPLVWDPFHTSRYESLMYVGLVPLFLALSTIIREFRRDSAVRFLTIVVLASLFLSLGPYVPGFRSLIAIPGFSFFRAPSRWSLVTSLGLALLAGKGFDRWSEWPRPGRSLVWFACAAFLGIVTVLGTVELSLACTAGPRWPLLTRVFEKAFAAMPWSGDPGFKAIMAQARKPVGDRRVPSGIAPSVFLQRAEGTTSFVGQRAKIYVWELWETAALLAVLLIVARLSQTGRLGGESIRACLLLTAFFDLWLLGRHRLLDVAPLRPLEQQSPVLARLAREPRGTRVVDAGLRNLPMMAGMAPISAYRTLDVPAVEALTSLAREHWRGPSFEPLVHDALRATGTGLRVFDPMENRLELLMKRAGEPREKLKDLALAGWLFGESWTEEQARWVADFGISRCGDQPARAWLLPYSAVADQTVFDDWSGDPLEVLNVFRSSRPLAAESTTPEKWTITLNTDEPSWVIVSQLADPQWTGHWLDESGRELAEAEIIPTFHKSGEPGGWQRVIVPGNGCRTLRLEYDASDVSTGLAISAIAWACWLMAAIPVRLRASFTQRAAP
jgi:hypothetical protein